MTTSWRTKPGRFSPSPTSVFFRQHEHQWRRNQLDSDERPEAESSAYAGLRAHVKADGCRYTWVLRPTRAGAVRSSTTGPNRHRQGRMARGRHPVLAFQADLPRLGARGLAARSRAHLRHGPHERRQDARSSCGSIVSSPTRRRRPRCGFAARRSIDRAIIRSFNPNMTLIPGTRLGPYEIRRPSPPRHGRSL